MKRALKWVLVIVAALAAGLFARTYLAGITRVAGDSMVPTLRSGDVALVLRFGDAPTRFDVVELTIPGRDGSYLKRVIGLPGERVDIISGVVHINGLALEEPYATRSDDDFSMELGSSEYFVLGDNRPESYDSRKEDFGVIHAGSFRGRVEAVVWPFSRFQIGID